ncbi:MAG: alpha/beta hydrolase [Terracoccus sp.]
MIGLAGCGDASRGSPQGAVSAATTAAPSTATDFTELVDIGGGRHLSLSCVGDGSPTVLFESGDESPGNQWGAVLVGVGATTRACAYDRLGVGSSDEATGCRGMTQLQADFVALLRAADLKPPYVIAGTSGGGYLAAHFAMTHPQDVRGLLVVDTFPAINAAKASPELRQELKCTNSTNVERRDYAAVEHAAWDHRKEIPGLAVTVISNRYEGITEGEEATSVQGQRGWLVLNPKGRQVVVTSGHNIPGNESGLVTDEVLALVEAVR